MFFLSIIPPVEVDTGFSYTDKLAHLTGFVFWAILFYRAFPGSHWTSALAWGLSFGIFIEVVQHFIPYRSMEFLDAVADCVGLALGMFIRRLVTSKINEKENGT